MDRAEIIAFLGQDWDRTVGYMHSTLGSDIALLQSVNMDILAHSGKMLRPIVCLLMAGACTGEKRSDDALRFAAASELLHNATLLHDDVADAADTRRGVPTLRSKLGPNAAVLVGDFWLASSVGMLIEAKHHEDVVKLFSRTLTELAEGEMLQLEKAMGGDTSEDDYLRIIHCKTASLFVTACECAAVASDASEQMREAAKAYAEALGLAFQIKDDILDYAGDGSLGKPVGIDLLEQKITMPLLCAMKDSPREKEIRSMVREIGSHPEYCDEIRKFVDERGGVQTATSMLEEYVNRALAALEAFPESKSREYLSQIARYNSIRTK